ncbi:MAG: hypothetical protein C0617_03745 [Desulfuromonas sp.]|uniref:YeeE/YedE family protein n=1 Tax=Desulfuromonas sp. TaxID=892 RepID=UPI000CC1F928|nr:YeeE/YedE family protein [Desulfuromonas sp.]PLX85633.1 MAG: hypothetical protein C0617_03745 [Desulfuromonas sp.]
MAEKGVVYLLIVVVCFFLGGVAGLVMHRSDYCIAGMFRDFFLFGETLRLRSLLLLVVASMVLFEMARQLGYITLYPFPLLGSPSLANLFGGALLGAGMVLAGGCVVGTLYRLGSGSLLSVLALAGLVAGSALYAEVHPWWGELVRNTTFFPGIVTLPQLLGIEPGLLVGAVVLAAGYPFWRWYRQGKWSRQTSVEGYLQPWKAALALALVGLVSYLAVGMPMGITTAYAKAGAFLEQLVMPEHVAGLAYFQGVPLDYTAPLGGVVLQGGAGPRFDAIALIQFPLIGGIVLGAAFSALRLGEFRIYLRVPWRQALSALAGGLIMGLAARMAPACNVWHLLGGVPILGMQSMLFVAGMVPGAWLGSRILTGLVLKSSR